MTLGDVTVGVLVVSGGASRRWGGVDKTARPLAGRPVLLHAAAGAVAGVRSVQGAREVPLCIVAPAHHEGRAAVDGALPGVRWTLEDPPGSGPVAALAAGLAELDDVATVVVLAGDLPFAGPGVPRLLAALAPGIDAAVGVDPAGHRQPLLAAYRTEALRAALAGLGAARPGRGHRAHALLTGLVVREVALTARETFDLDTPEALTQAEAALAPGSPEIF